MNRGVVQRSPVQQMTAAGNSIWWSMNNMITKPSAPPPPDLLPPPPPPPSSSTFWVDDNQELPAESISWSQLLSAGLVGENDNGKSELSYLLPTKNGEENWEEQLLPPSNGHNFSDIRQLLTKSFMYGHVTEEYQMSPPAKTFWLTSTTIPKPEPLPVSPYNTLNSNNNLLAGHSLETLKECNVTGGSAVANKKARVQHSSTQSTFKVRKEKLGDRITSLHQLVSPFGKTDTASVLLEAIGYIRFLHSQVEALSVPYLGKTSGLRQHHRQQNDHYEEPKKDLRSRGLCLVPISSTFQVGNDINGADYWAPVHGDVGGGGGFR